MIADEQLMTSTLPDTVSALAASPNFVQDGLCFAARNSGLYRSSDGGVTWHNAYESLALEEPLATTALALSPNFAVDHTVFAGVNGGVLHSVDGGTTWFSVIFPDPAPLVTTLAVSPHFAEDGVVFAGTLEDGVFRSADRGSSWAAWNFGLLDLSVLALAVSPHYANDETIFAGTESGVFRSTNGGRAWREIDFPTEWAPVLSMAFAPHADDRDVLFVGTEEHSLFRSDDLGATWARCGEDIVGGAVNTIAVAPYSASGTDVLIPLGDTLLLSRDGGSAWEPWRATLRLDESIASVAAPHGFAPTSPLLIGLVEGGVLRL